MNDLFVSYSRQDTAAVDRVCDALVALGFNYWRDDARMRGSEGMKPNEGMLETVRTMGIYQAQVALLCLSDRACDSEWVNNEVAFCFESIRDPRRPLRSIIPVQVGTLDMDKRPMIIKQENRLVLDLTQPGTFHEHLRTLARALCEDLGRASPVVIPAALFAMTRTQCEELLEDTDAVGRLAQLCGGVGLSEQAFRDQLLSRYGDTPEGFRPFRADRTLRESIQEILTAVNQDSRGTTKPVALHWMGEELASSNRKKVMEAGRIWKADCSLSIVDSASAFHPSVQAQLSAVPHADRPDRSALLWLPPFTRHTEELTALTLEALGSNRLISVFDDWKLRPERLHSFDVTSSAGYRRWLSQTCATLVAGRRASPKAVQAMNAKVAGAKPSLHNLFGGARTSPPPRR